MEEQILDNSPSLLSLSLRWIVAIISTLFLFSLSFLVDHSLRGYQIALLNERIAFHLERKSSASEIADDELLSKTINKDDRSALKLLRKLSSFEPKADEIIDEAKRTARLAEAEKTRKELLELARPKTDRVSETSYRQIYPLAEQLFGKLPTP